MLGIRSASWRTSGVWRVAENKSLQPPAGTSALWQPPVEREDRLQIPRVQQPISLVEDEELHRGAACHS